MVRVIDLNSANLQAASQVLAAAVSAATTGRDPRQEAAEGLSSVHKIQDVVASKIFDVAVAYKSLIQSAQFSGSASFERSIRFLRQPGTF